MPTAKKSLIAKLVEIAKEIGDKEPVRHSDGVAFAYHAARDVYGWWRPLLHEAGILMVPTIQDQQVQSVELPRRGGGTRKTFLTTVVMGFTFMDTESGETLAGSAIGQGEDPADKGSGKAMTYAEKSFLLGLGMNGADRDVEDRAEPGSDYEGGAEIGDSDIKGIEKGGRPTTTTEVQVTRFRQLARELGYDAAKTGALINDILGSGPTMPEVVEDQGPALIKYVSGLKSEDMGKVIQYMEQMTGDDETA